MNILGTTALASKVDFDHSTHFALTTSSKPDAIHRLFLRFFFNRFHDVSGLHLDGKGCWSDQIDRGAIPVPAGIPEQIGSGLVRYAGGLSGGTQQLRWGSLQ